MNWYKFYKLSSYNNEIAYLRDYLKSGFSPYDFSYYLKAFLENNDLIRPQWQENWFDLEHYDLIEEWDKIANDNEKEQFKQFVIGKHEDDSDSPSYTAMDFYKVAKPDWLVHFTDDPWSIQAKGFIYGHEDFTGLHLTTWKRDEYRKKYAGYNFAFEAFSRYAKWAANEHKYGKNCVMFWGAAVKITHYGDKEDQMIFWGPSINKNMIFPILNDAGSSDWIVPSEVRERVFSGSFEDCCHWIKDNYVMLQQIKEKEEKQKREYLRKQRSQ